MTQPNDAVDTAIQAYLDYLEGVAEEPSLEGLTPEERAEVEKLIESLKAGRGMNPYASKPSLEEQLAGTDLEELLRRLEAAPAEVAESLLDHFRTEITAYGPYHCDIWRDSDAVAAGVRSDFLAVIGSHRLRLQVRHDLLEPADLAGIDPADAAGAIYGRFPETAGVILVAPDSEFSSVPIDPMDSEDCLQAPDGALFRPTIHRPILPLVDTLRSYIDEIAPPLELTGTVNLAVTGDFDLGETARSVAAAAVANIEADATKAKIPAKRMTWGAFGDREVRAIAQVLLDCLTGLDDDEIDARIDDMCDAA